MNFDVAVLHRSIGNRVRAQGARLFVDMDELPGQELHATWSLQSQNCDIRGERDVLDELRAVDDRATVFDGDISARAANARKEGAQLNLSRAQANLRVCRQLTLPAGDRANLAMTVAAGCGSRNPVSFETLEHGLVSVDFKDPSVKSDAGHGRRLFTQNVGTQALELGSDGLDMMRRNVEFGERRTEVFDHGVEVRVVEALFDQFSMRGSHVLTGIVVGATESHREKGGLLGSLILHVGGLKEVRDALITEDLAVEDVYSGLNGGGASEDLVQRLLVGRWGAHTFCMIFARC